MIHIYLYIYIYIYIYIYTLRNPSRGVDFVRRSCCAYRFGKASLSYLCPMKPYPDHTCSTPPRWYQPTADYKRLGRRYHRLGRQRCAMLAEDLVLKLLAVPPDPCRAGHRAAPHFCRTLTHMRVMGWVVGWSSPMPAFVRLVLNGFSAAGGLGVGFLWCPSLIKTC